MDHALGQRIRELIFYFYPNMLWVSFDEATTNYVKAMGCKTGKFLWSLDCIWDLTLECWPIGTHLYVVNTM